MENEERKCTCGMPLNEKTECSCNSEVCVYCCSCPPDCKCGCQEKKDQPEQE